LEAALTSNQFSRGGRLLRFFAAEFEEDEFQS
jgi:hypothetical protein